MPSCQAPLLVTARTNAHHLDFSNNLQLFLGQFCTDSLQVTIAIGAGISIPT